MAPPQLLSLEKQFHFYKHYHTNTINKRIHIVFVPVIIVTFLAIAAQVHVPLLSLDLSLVVTAGYIFYGIALDLSIGLYFTPFLLAACAASRWFCRFTGPGTIPWAVTLNLAAWVAQFVGHFTFEGNSPALFDSVVSSVLAAPIVIWLEVTFSLGFLQETKARLARSRVAAKARRAVKQVDGSVST